MDLPVLRRRDELEISKAVVTTVAVDVMDMLVGLQRPAQMLFHDPAIPVHLPPIDVDQPPT
jgi:hypothetical protein